MNGANQAVSGGIGGFLAFFLLACALWLLMRNMNKRLQNVKYDEELEQKRQAAEADDEVVTRPPLHRDDTGGGSDGTGGPDAGDGREGRDGPAGRGGAGGSGIGTTLRTAVSAPTTQPGARARG